ncbi:MAG TPA: RNA polymerase sporulation sigma factor SigH [Mycobacteriales bacterium]|nr:RNA polymerase sporulation sigma factor SigH [Mycobacteriales bacterium]
MSTAVVDADAAERAGTAAAVELVLDAPVTDLRDAVPDELRAAGPSAAPAPAPGCPCGCGETELLLRARGGDERAVEELLDRYRALARAKARSYFLLGGEHDDVLQEGMIGLYKAIRDYAPDLGVPFGAFAEMCVTRQLVSAVRAAGRHKHAPLTRAASLDEPVRGQDDLRLADLLPAASAADPADAVVSADEVRALQQHFAQVLSDLEQQVLRHHVEGKSYDQIAAMLQRHVKSVDNALQRIKRKLETHLEGRLAEA